MSKKKTVKLRHLDIVRIMGLICGVKNLESAYAELEKARNTNSKLYKEIIHAN